ncbi:SusD/RagB family nutrient-binding outer membrane lipoprotein [Flexithrix dorotheae]|uniref:SusD/RagB family nutrient-binding outer membrane lipoprotein n=1 Tax=Flexithrix dorotheae TaxID=70993 RepID=UPI00037516A5|nr:SusD/RagB family nutrient-binding outer membrane lipoprotein [Flexithrix dorotheae]
MINSNTNKIWPFILSFLMIVACTDEFDEINTNPNVPEQVNNPGLLLPAIIRGTMNDHFTGSWRRGAVVSDYLANQFVSAFDWTPSDANEYFFWDFYGELRDVQNMIEISEENEFLNYKGIALVYRSFLFQSLTDIYGDIPYSEAIKAKSGNINFPKYDTQEAIYSGILADLEEANSILGTGSESVTGDILYNGDLLNWRKFANGLQLRILLRQSKRKDPTADMQRILGDPDKYPLFTSHEDQAALQYLEELGNEFPRYRVTVGSFGGTTHISTTLEKQLKDLNDPRLYVFAQPTPATVGTANPEYLGVPNGIVDEDTYNGGSANQSPPGLLWAPIDWSDEASPNAAQSLLMTYSELQFILAESVEKGYIDGDAETFYMNGIKDQFEYYASRIPQNFSFPTAANVIPDASYYTQDLVAYSGSAEDKLKKIGLQKWLALFNCGFEGWSEWRRTGIPEITPGPNSTGVIPLRHFYPLSESNLNNKNYSDANARQGADVLQTKVWWDVD